MVDPDEIAIRALLEAIYVEYHYDFRSYSIASLKRRLSAALIGLRYDTLSSLAVEVAADPDTFARLLQYLTITVSDLFRDPIFFRTLREKIAPLLQTYPSLKVWIAGCSTGEEVYSFAVLLREEGLLDRTILYATDINPEALRKAEAGIYPVERGPGFAEHYRLAGGKGSLSAHYTAAYGAIAFDRSLRKNVVFSDHSLATDSVFAEVQVVSCRNVLIYFDRELQSRALSLMNDSLCRRGFLGLGAKETLQSSTVAAAFHELVPGGRWYQRW